jgi:hypothetical protein
METNKQVLEIVRKAILDIDAIKPSRDGQSMTDEDLKYKQVDYALNEAFIAAQVLANVPDYLRAQSKY